MDRSEIRKLAELEDSHWWYRERRHLLARQIRGMTPGRAVDVGAAAGGNTRVLLENGWDSVALEYSEDGAGIARARGLPVLRGDALALPFPDASLDLVVSFDVLEHIEDDDRAVQEFHRVLREGATALIAVPADPRLWSAHDVAVGHVRRYTRDDLGAAARAQRTGRRDDQVVERPAAASGGVAPPQEHGQRSGADVTCLNAALRAVVAAERYLPVTSWPGVSLMVRARRR